LAEEAGRQAFFFKKRTKKLLSDSDSTEFPRSNSVPAAMDESFLLLFSKKKTFLAFSFCL
jgi:hypothetical protein